MVIPLEQLGAVEDLGLGLQWSAATLREETARRAAALSERGIGPGALVAVDRGASAHFLADLLAVWHVGAAAACLDPTLTGPERATLARFIAATAPTGTGAALDDPALVLFTSGTTGSPKGVVLSFRALLTRVELNAEAIGKAALARALVTLPFHFGHGLIGNALTPLLAGGTLVLPPRGSALAQNLGAMIDEHAITFMSSVPALWRLALRTSRPPRGGSLVRVHVGSAPLPARLWSDIAAWSGAEVVNCYGLTEMANWFAGASSHTDGIEDGLVGKPWGGVAAVLDASGVVRATGAGEIVLKSPTAMLGYLHRPDLTAAAHHDGWYRTGDGGDIDGDGQIRLRGRIKDEINRAGFKVQPEEIDRLLESHPAVVEACVFGIPDRASGEVVAAAVKLAAGARENAETLRAWCRERLRREAVPEHWFMVDEMPRTARGKISRELMRRTLVKEAPDGVVV